MAHLPSYVGFKNALREPEKTQQSVLRRYLKELPATEAGRTALGGRDCRDYRTFANTFPVTCYADWEPWIKRQKSSPRETLLAKNCRRFEPTSGSTEARKWIPYSDALLREFNSAASAWIYDLSKRFPISRGKHYWSLSWLPDDLRAEGCVSDDSQVFPAWKRLLINQMMAVPCETANLASTEQALLATLVYLSSCRELTLISVWSPTFALELLRSLSERRLEISQILSSGSWNIPGLKAPRSREVASLLRDWDGRLEPGFLRDLWPDLSLISSWDSSTSAQWASQLRALFPHVPLQGKGLWATEGVVSIPFENSMPAAVTSHFIEFRCLETGRIFPLWEAEQGQRVQPILTTGSGLVRYALQDRLEITGFLHKTPTLRFISRLSGTDMVGEKLDVGAVSQVLESISREYFIHCVSLLACTGDRPQYSLLVDGKEKDSEKIAGRLEELLMNFHHYRLARELGQLQKASVIFRDDALGYYRKLRGPTSPLAGAQKLEPLTLCQESLP